MTEQQVARLRSLCVYWSEEDNCFLAYSTDTAFKGYVAHGDTILEAVQAFLELEVK